MNARRLAVRAAVAGRGRCCRVAGRRVSCKLPTPRWCRRSERGPGRGCRPRSGLGDRSPRRSLRCLVRSRCTDPTVSVPVERTTEHLGGLLHGRCGARSRRGRDLRGVTWRVTSDDGLTISGSWFFHVGERRGAVALGDDSGDRATEVVAWLARVLFSAGVIGVSGVGVVAGTGLGGSACSPPTSVARRPVDLRCCGCGPRRCPRSARRGCRRPRRQPRRPRSK